MSSSRDPKSLSDDAGRRVWRGVARRLVAKAREDMEEPGAADVDVDGVDESGSWDEPSAEWMNKSASSLDMVAAVHDGELLAAMDSNRRGASDVRFWAIKLGPPFELYRLSNVPMRDALPLNDFGKRVTRFRDGRQAWALARRYADPRPFKRVR